MKFGKCGHPLHPTEGCRVCWTAENMTRAQYDRATRKKPIEWTMKVTSVVAGDKKTMAAIEAGASVIPFASVTDFTEGQAIELVDNSHERYRERENYRGREQDANAWVFTLPRSVMKRLLGHLRVTTVGDIAEVHAAENALRNLGLTFSRHEALMAWEITVDSGESRAFAEAVLDSERAWATRDIKAAWGAELATVRFTLAAAFGPTDPPDGADARIGHTWAAVERALQRVIDGPPLDGDDDAWRPPHIDEVDDVLREVGWMLVSETLPPASRRRGMFRAQRMKTYAEAINEPQTTIDFGLSAANAKVRAEIERLRLEHPNATRDELCAMLGITPLERVTE